MEYYKNEPYRYYQPIQPNDNQKYLVTVDDNSTMVIVFTKNCSKDSVHMGWDSFLCNDENNKKYLYMLPDVFEGNQPYLILLSDDCDYEKYTVDVRFLRYDCIYDIVEMKSV